MASALPSAPNHTSSVCWFARQTPHNPFMVSAFPPKPQLARAARAWQRPHIYVSPSGESSKGATARAWLGDAHSYSPPSRPAGLLMIVAATSVLGSHSRSIPPYPLPHVDQHTSPTTRSACFSRLRAYPTVGAELSARPPTDRLWRPIRCRLRLSQMSRPPAVRCRGERRAHAKWGGVRCGTLDLGASSMYMYGHDRGAHAARSVEGA